MGVSAHYHWYMYQESPRAAGGRGLHEPSLLRETALTRLARRADREALRRGAALVAELWLEHDEVHPLEGEALPVQEARAAVVELRHLEGWLAMVGRHGRASVLTGEEQRLCREAAEVAVEVGRSAGRLEEALAQGWPQPPEPLEGLWRDLAGEGSAWREAAGTVIDRALAEGRLEAGYRERFERLVSGGSREAVLADLLLALSCPGWPPEGGAETAQDDSGRSDEQGTRNRGRGR